MLEGKSFAELAAIDSPVGKAPFELGDPELQHVGADAELRASHAALLVSCEHLIDALTKPCQPGEILHVIDNAQAAIARAEKLVKDQP